MLCCPNCFKDRGLERQIIPRLAERTGECPLCKSQNMSLVEAKKLGDYFEVLCGIYKRDECGEVLIDWLIDDWDLFNLERAMANSLLVEILDDGERVRELVVPSELYETKNLDGWQALRDELRHNNRFFPETDFELERLEQLVSNLLISRDEWPLEWYRARIETSGNIYEADEMRAPPKELASHGRANPAGIPYLYLGSTAETAIAEVRPYPGERVCVAKFRIEDDLRIIDLRNPRMLISPFLLADEREVGLMRGDIEFLERLGDELTTPVLPDAAAIDYIPSQYLCEYVKKCGYAGVLYSSSVSQGVNVALFDPSVGGIEVVSEHLIDRVDVHAAMI